MNPSERRDVRQQLGRIVRSIMLSLRDGVSKMPGVPVDDDSGGQVQTSHAEALPFGGTVTDFALASDAQGIFEGVMGFALVESDPGAARAMSA